MFYNIFASFFHLFVEKMSPFIEFNTRICKAQITNDEVTICYPIR